MIRTSNSPAASNIVRETANYFGIEVAVVLQMEHSSLIQYGDLKVVVDTEDLVYAKAMKTAA